MGEIVSRLSSDVTQMRAMLTTNVTSLLSQLVTLIGAVVIVLTLNANLTMFILGLLPVLILVAFVILAPEGIVGLVQRLARRRRSAV